MTIDIPPELEADFAALARAEGVSPQDYVRGMLEREVKMKLPKGQPLKSFYGALAKHGPAPSAEEIDENRAEMFRNFARGDE
ncbi:MAG: hypothetical protein HYR60_25235 [Acidobacteria bacterium]|nr:hypothetical protein [Acidobacteriota bacterium]